MKRLLISNLFRKFTFRTYKACFSVFTLAHIQLAKKLRHLPASFDTRSYQRTNHTSRVAGISEINKVVDYTMSNHNIPVIRPFSIHLHRIV